MTRYDLWINVSIEAETEDAAFDYAFEAAELAEGQGLMDHRPEVLISWSVEGPSKSEKMWTLCEKCGKLNIEIVDGMAPEFCEACNE
jgi:Zn finger protein HypA/HybF involved in hydrogenase expression